MDYQGVDSYFFERFATQVDDYRAGRLPFEEFADWCEAVIEERRQIADCLLNECQGELYMSFCERSARRQHESVNLMEEAYELIFSFINGGEEAMLDEAYELLKQASGLMKDAIELNEECMELDGGVTGHI